MKNISLPRRIIDFLKKDPVQNANILNFSEDNPVTDFYQEGNSVLVKGISDREWIYISSNNDSEFKALFNRIEGENLNFAVIEDWQIPIIKEKIKFRTELSAIKYYLPEDIHLPSATSSFITPLSINDANYIYENNIYKEFTPVEYIKERISKGIGYGLVLDNKLAAWAITHDDGALGFLHVLDEHRNKGYAKEIIYSMISKVREKGRIPFAQIEEGNYKSINLVKKLGFEKFKTVHWISKID